MYDFYDVKTSGNFVCVGNFDSVVLNGNILLSNEIFLLILTTFYKIIFSLLLSLSTLQHVRWVKLGEIKRSRASCLL